MVSGRFRATMEIDHSLRLEGGIMITIVWIATLITVLGSIELLARTAATEES